MANGVYLTGGPCDGRTVPNTQIEGGLVATIQCGGGYYVLADGQTRPNGDIVFRWWGTKKPSPPSPPGPQHAMQAWSRWMRMLGHTGPQAHKRVVRVAHRARRIAR